MPKAISDNQRIINFFMSSDLAAADQALDTIKGIVANRKKAASPASSEAPATRKPRQKRNAAANGAPTPPVATETATFIE